MATKLTKNVHRVTEKRIQGRNVIVTLAPGKQGEGLIGLRLQGKRTQYVAQLADVYRMAALWHGQKVAAAKKAARKEGISWPRVGKKRFDAQNRL